MRLLKTVNTCKIISLASRRNLKTTYAVNHIPSNASNDVDQVWLHQLKQTIAQNLNNSQLNSTLLARLMFMSRAHFYRKTKTLSHLAPGQLIKQARLQKAVLLLENNQSIAVKEVAGEVGYKDVKYFSQQFKKTFGQYPSEWVG